MKLKEKRPSPEIEQDWFAAPAAAPGKWLGVFQHPDLGVRIVRDRQNAVRLFPEATAATDSAKDALLWALKQRPVIRVTREFIPKARGRRWAT
jgi:hypothetical protein